jgi:hypothetical protein
MLRRAIFCRIGWMKYYDGKKAGDLKPVGGGSWNKMHAGGEIFNFRNIGGLYYGFCQPSASSSKINLERIDPNCRQNIIRGVLVIFVAVDPDRGRQRVVGWYRDATVYRSRQKSTSKRREKIPYFAVAAVSNSVLLPVEPYKRNLFVKAGTGGIGEANACYLYRTDGRPKNLRWQKQILRKI